MYITDLSDPVFHFEKVKKALAKGEKAILITKNPAKLLSQLETLDPETLSRVLVQATVTGLGGTVWEPNVPKMEESLSALPHLARLLDGRVAVRFDPIIPGANDLPEYWLPVLGAAKAAGCLGVTASVVDQYPHVKTRLRKAGLFLPFDGFHFEGRNNLIQQFIHHADKVGIPVRVCCEYGFTEHQPGRGCDWSDHLTTPEELAAMKPGDQRKGCTCPKYTQLLTYFDACGHGCLYCYRKDKGALPVVR